MKVKHVARLAGGKAKLARLLGITPQAVSKWQDSMPEHQVCKLMCLRPRLFAEALADELAELRQSLQR